MIDVLDAARRLDVPFYTVDPRGEMAPPLGLDGHLEDQVPGRLQGLWAAILAQRDGNHVFANETGSRAFVGYSNLTRALNELMTDTGSYYLLGFYPSPYAEDGKFHSVEVKVRRPGLRVRARQGYTSEKPGSASGPPTRLADSLAAGTPGVLLLRGAAMPLAPSHHGAETLVTLDVTYPEATDETPRARDRLQVIWLALDPDGGLRASGQRDIEVPLAGTGRAPLTLTLSDVLDLPKGQTMLRIAASSRMFRTSDTVHVAVDVPPLTGDTLDLTPLVLGIEATPDVRVAHLGTSAKTEPFPPTTRRTFTPADRVRVFARIFTPDPSPVSAELRLKRDETVLVSVPMRVTPAKSARHAGDCNAVLAFSGLVPGPYALELVARLPTGAVVQRAIAVEITPRPR